ncbi:hypothetical protein [Heyndrickxia sporothermodurans]|uniref:hypothetical protein n=1 Tax=Heyndrickxia sporothermodurans TaxID=46224 RepID=UPI000D33C5B8|nr:hypothetical protein [Heyndrickxia sporothermodurans]PTY93059.1 hypothetical protein B5V90_02950 [Heyndrickxia sporothermodurans]
MSSSSLWVMDKDFYGSEMQEFSNSWWLSPIAWDILFQKYTPEKVTSQFGTRTTFMTATMFDNTIHSLLNERINNSEEQIDRIVWELSQQQVFFSKDRKLVADALRQFLSLNAEYASDAGEHIHERFNEVADEIEDLVEDNHPYFVFKNTSVDDNVEFWFGGYNDEDDYEKRSLKDMDRLVTEFVNIEDGKITGWKNNLQFFGKTA